MPNFNNNIPLATDFQDQSQPQLLANNQQIGTILKVNDGVIDFTAQPAPPAANPTLAGLGLWTKLMPTVLPSPGGTGTNRVELYVTDGSGNDFPMTAIQNTNNAMATLPAIGWSYLASGLILKWGIASATGTANFSLTGNGPNYSQIVTIMSNTVSNPFFVNYTVTFNNTVPSQFTLTYNGTDPLTISYLALGF